MLFIGILTVHWVGDFLLQTSTMAQEKAHSIKWLLLHVGTYTLILFIGCQFFFSWQVALGFTVVNGALHLVTDFFTSKLAARYQDNPRVFYPILGFDQLIHTACLYWAYLNSDVLAL